MGLISGLLTLPLAPVRGVTWIADQIREQAEREYNDPAVIRAQLNDLDRAYAAGQLGEQERDELQATLVARLLPGPG